jgi:hypothetical protein
MAQYDRALTTLLSAGAGFLNRLFSCFRPLRSPHFCRILMLIPLLLISKVPTVPRGV